MKQFIYPIKFVSGSCLLILCLSSCKVFQSYKLPEVDSIDMYGGLTKEDSTTIASIPWREFFSDQCLIELIEEGLQNNHDMQIAISRIKQAEANLNIAKKAYYPELSVGGQANYSSTSNGANGKDVFGYHTTNYQLSFSATWEIDLWGKLNRQSKAKYADYLNSKVYRNLVQTSLIADIANSYYSLLSLDKQLEITINTAELLKENVATMEALKKAGVQNGAAVEQSKSLYYSTLSDIPDLERQILQTQSALCTLLGKKITHINRSGIDEQPVPDSLQYGVPAQMLANRPDVLRAELSVRSAFELTQAARASLYPSLSLSSGSIGYETTNSLSAFFKPENLFANVIGGLTQPLFARGQLKGNLRVAEEEQHEALISFYQTALNAAQEVVDVLADFEASVKKEEPRALQIESCVKSLDYTQKLLKAGDANYTEVLTAEENLLSAQLAKVNDKLTQLQSLVSLYKALGGGVE